MQMLNSNENEEDSESWMFEEVERRNPVAAKKYSLWDLIDRLPVNHP